MSIWEQAVDGALLPPETETLGEKIIDQQKRSGRPKGRQNKPEDPNDKVIDFEMNKYINDAVAQISVVENKQNKEILEKTPAAFVEPAVKPYTEDALDRILAMNMQSPGFVTDFINTGRGMESPTLFLLWNALWIVSTIITREAYLKWYPKSLYPNLYVLLVAPPSLCRKSSSIEMARWLIQNSSFAMPDTLMAYKKNIKMVSGKSTGEGLLDILSPQEKTFFDQDKMITIEKGSQAALCISEFAMFLGKQQYNNGLVTLLTSLFDSADVDSELTRNRGDKPLKDIYVTLLGAITPDGMRTAIPKEAFGGGFMSRIIIAYQDVPTKLYAIPKRMDGYPSIDDLVYPLTWIAVNAVGEYTLTQEALEFYTNWYRIWKDELFRHRIEEKEEFRFDNLLLRVATLLRIQEYRKGTDIQLWHIKAAKAIIEHTQRLSKRVTDNMDGNEYSNMYSTVKRKIEREGVVVRSKLLSALSPRGISARNISEIINQLSQEGTIKIRLHGKIMESCSNNGSELYELIGGSV